MLVHRTGSKHSRNHRARTPQFLPHRAAAWSVVSALLLSHPLSPAEIVVEGGCTLADAIDAANDDLPVGDCTAGSGADEIRLTEDVELTEVDNTDNGPNGLPTVESEIFVRGDGFAIRRVPGSPDFRILRNGATGRLTLENVRVADGSLDRDDGAGILNEEGSVHLIGSVVTGSTAQAAFGVGIRNTRGDVTLTNSRVTASEPGNFYGGALFNRAGKMRLINSTIAGNTSCIRNDFAGAVLTLIDSLVMNNDFCRIHNSGSGTVRIIRSTLANNDDNHGAIYNEAGSVTLRNSTVSGNAVGVINGDYLSQATMTIVNSTITGNGSDGVENRCKLFGGCAPQKEAWVFLANSIVADNEGDDCNGNGDFFPSGANFDSDGTCDEASPITGLDPILADHGGPTPTHALLEGSSAIDAAGECGHLFDQRGLLRDRAACDSGSFEFAAAAVDPRLTVSGDCPGEVTLSLTGATPGRSIALASGSRRGLTLLPRGVCEGAAVGLDEAEHRGRFQVDASGERIFTRDVAAERCGTYFQAIDLTTCAVGDAVQLPSDEAGDRIG